MSKGGHGGGHGHGHGVSGHTHTQAQCDHYANQYNPTSAAYAARVANETAQAGSDSTGSDK